MKVDYTESIKRLRKLAWLLRRVKEPGPRRATGLDTYDQAVFKCGTASCAAGWAASYPWFQKLGLRMRKLEGGSIQFWDGQNWSGDIYGTLADFFGIAYNHSTSLFCGGDDTALRKAGQVERLITKLTKEHAKNGRKKVKTAS